MKGARSLLGVVGVGLVAFAAKRTLELPCFRSGALDRARATDHLTGQASADVAIELAAATDLLAVEGEWSGRIAGIRAGVVRFVAAPEIVVSAATLDGEPLVERAAVGDSWVARPAAFRELQGARAAGGMLRVRFRQALQRGDTPVLWAAETALLPRFGADEIPALADRAFTVRDALALPSAAALLAPPRAAGAFALDPGTDHLAVAVGADGQAPGVVVLAGTPRGAATPRFLALPEEADRLQWAAGGADVLARLRSGRFVLLDVQGGMVRRLDGEVELAADGMALLERREVAPGAFVQRRLELRSTALRATRIAGTRAVRFADRGAELLRTAADGAIEWCAPDGAPHATLPIAAAGCRAAFVTPLGPCVLVDTPRGARVIAGADGGVRWTHDVDGRVEQFAVDADGRELLLLLVDAARPSSRRLARISLLESEPTLRVRTLWSGALRPLRAPDRHGLLLADPAGRADGAHRLWYLPAAALEFADAEGAAAAAPRPAAAAAFLDPPPVISSDGRYLFLRRAPDGALWCHDLLLGGDEPVAVAAR